MFIYNYHMFISNYHMFIYNYHMFISNYHMFIYNYHMFISNYHMFISTSPSSYISQHYGCYSLAGCPLPYVAGTTLFFLFHLYIVSMRTVVFQEFFYFKEMQILNGIPYRPKINERGF